MEGGVTSIPKNTKYFQFLINSQKVSCIDLVCILFKSKRNNKNKNRKKAFISCSYHIFTDLNKNIISSNVKTLCLQPLFYMTDPPLILFPVHVVSYKIGK